MVNTELEGEETEGTNFLDIMTNISAQVNDINSPYINTTQLANKSHFSIAHLNIRSIDKNGNALINLLEEINLNIDIITLSEIWGNHNDFKHPEYQPMVVNLRKNKRGGGVGIILKKNIKFSVIEELSKLNNNIEIITIKVKTNNSTRLISSVYRPPNPTLADINNFLSDINNLLEYKNSHFQDIKFDILGDFNLNTLLHSTSINVRDFINKFEEHNLTSLINRPTRISHNQPSIIDNIFSNNFDNSEQFILPVSISDHFIILKSEPKTTQLNEESTSTYTKRCFYEQNTLSFQTVLLNTNWETVFIEEDPIKKWDIFLEKLDSAFLDAFPIKTFKIKNKIKSANPWICNELKKQIKKERKMYLKKLKNPSQQNIIAHKNYKLTLNSNIRRAKTAYFENQFKNSENNPRVMWSKINDLTNNKKKNNDTIDKLIINNDVITDKEEIASNFNNFFTNIGQNLAENITINKDEQQLYLDGMKNHNCRFKFNMVTLQDLLKLEKSLKPKLSSGPDDIPSKIIKKAIITIPFIFLHLINISIITGTIHDRLKEAIIIPIHKKGDKNDPNNYRPISLINAISKILEKIVAFQLRKYLENNHLLNNQQFGFRTGHSTTHAMISALNHLETQKLNKSGSTSIFIDLTKAFDTVDIDLLLTKLKKYGIQNTELRWFENYLKGRKQSCKINGHKSNVKIVKIGVPQGSILGPLLFIIYINDFPDVNNNFISLFADDTKITISSKNKQEAETKSNLAMFNANKWFINNKLTLNLDKTRIINFNMNSNKPTVTLENKSIIEINSNNPNSNEKSFKFLGFHLDEKLNFEIHTQKVINKLNSANHILRKIKNTIPIKQKILIYNAIFKPHLEYGALIWAKNKKNINTIMNIQKKAIRTIDGAKNKKHTEFMFKKFKTLKFEDLITANILMIAHSVVHKYAPDAIKQCIIKVETHGRLRRNTNNLQVDSSDKNSITKHIIPSTWNNLNNITKEIKDKKRFKKVIFKSLLDKYSSNQRCNERNCRICKNN